MRWKTIVLKRPYIVTPSFRNVGKTTLTIGWRYLSYTSSFTIREENRPGRLLDEKFVGKWTQYVRRITTLSKTNTR